MNKTFEIESKIDNLRIVEKAIDELLGDLGLAREAYGKIMVSTLEAVNNAIVHGNKGIESRNVKITLEIVEREFVVCIEDEGEGFFPEKIPDPTRPENIENIRGRGVFLMKNLADSISFNERGNMVIMKFKDISI
jgi:serine/threonine-protein kinase RsbW